MLEQPREKTKEPVDSLDTLGHSVSTNSATDGTSSWLPTPLQAVGHSTNYALNPFTNDTNDMDDDNSTCSSVNFAAVESLIDRGILDMDKCEQLLNLFRDTTSYFPFVLIDSRSTVQSMTQDHPFLLLAILTTASSADKRLQTMLDHEFRVSLSQKVVLDGEKSLDMLQGLLVYLAWSARTFGPS